MNLATTGVIEQVPTTNHGKSFGAWGSKGPGAFVCSHSISSRVESQLYDLEHVRGPRKRLTLHYPVVRGIRSPLIHSAIRGL